MSLISVYGSYSIHPWRMIHHLHYEEFWGFVEDWHNQGCFCLSATVARAWLNNTMSMSCYHQPLMFMPFTAHQEVTYYIVVRYKRRWKQSNKYVKSGSLLSQARIEFWPRLNSIGRNTTGKSPCTLPTRTAIVWSHVVRFFTRTREK